METMTQYVMTSVAVMTRVNLTVANVMGWSQS